MPVETQEIDVRNDTPAGKLLLEIRERHQYGVDKWEDAKTERDTDLKYICGDPWDKDDRQERFDAGRPCINHDELGQYVNACVNTARQNKKGIKIDPDGNGADEKSAKLRQGLIQRVEYRSKASSIYLNAFQSMVEGSYGFIRLARKYAAGDTFDQEIVVKPIANPNSVIYYPDCKEPDWSDAEWCFVLDPINAKEFKRRWPKAQKVSFTDDDRDLAKNWIVGDDILVAEYWKIETKYVTLYQLHDGTITRVKPQGRYARDRERPVKSLVQYMTNGVEILSTNPQPGELIPIIPFIGLERWVDNGTGAKRVLFSLPRLARDPQMSLAYLNSLEMEEAGLTPKTPYVGYKGQFESDKKAWTELTKVPYSFVQADPIVDESTGQVLPLPRREQFTPNFAAYEVAKDSCRRAIQAAMGITPLPTAAQRNNEKSGVALQQIQSQAQIGSYHFTDGFDRALALAGRVMDGWLDTTYDGERELAIPQDDESHQMLKLNTQEPYPDPKTQELQHHRIGAENPGDHNVTISTQPSYDSMFQQVNEFLNGLVANLKNIPPAGTPQAKILGKAIRMRQMGIGGDQLADIIDPPEQNQMPPQAQQQIDAAHQLIQQLTQALNKQTQKLEAKLPELASRERIAALNNKTTIISALIAAKSDEERLVYQGQLDHIDRILSLIPDPAQETSGGDGETPAPAGPQGPQPAGDPGLHVVGNPGGGAPPAAGA